MTISERIEGRREQRVLARVCRAAWRLEQAERERVRALRQLAGVPRAELAKLHGMGPSPPEH